MNTKFNQSLNELYLLFSTKNPVYVIFGIKSCFENIKYKIYREKNI